MNKNYSLLIDEALLLTKTHFTDKVREDGISYYEHTVRVYDKIKSLGYDEKYQLVSILCSVLEHTDITIKELEKEFGTDIADAVQVLTIDTSSCPAIEFIQVKEATAEDLTCVVRFADRLTALEQTTIHSASPKIVERMINKTKAYYIPNFNGDFKETLEKEVSRLEKELDDIE